MGNMGIYCDPAKRHDFVLLFDVADGNPNGDPDAGNMPRVDPETMQGLVTDVCLKRKIRNFVSLTTGEEPGNRIYIQDKGIALVQLHEEAYAAKGVKSTGSKQKREDVDKVRAWMCENFYDIRLFGAVMTLGVNCGQVRGPVQFTFARSVDPIFSMDVSITRVAIARKEDAEVIQGEDGKTTGKSTEMGRKAVVPYGLYRAHGFFSAPFAVQTGVSETDLSLLWTALQHMWDLDHSASRGMMGCRGLYVFTHDDRLGKAPAQDLFTRIQVTRKESVESPRSIHDYTVTVSDTNLPEGITLTRLVG